MDVIITIRPEFSNYNNPNHRKATVIARLERKFQKIDAIIEKHTAKMIGEPTIQAVEAERTKYLALPREKEAVA